eukprot:TRINITY_DN12258_c0_g1_i1.p1 TRINITY_DN12258_c0_g1~~TRINITY_DN12258_c0_g1_i1.p1  ORF type:complete len:117 (+),score=5.50 TRINITY_DN12258_c0_g1_i1:124-474(+)
MPKRKGFFAGDQKKCEIGFRFFVETLLTYGGPSDDVDYFINQIEDVDLQHQLCMKYGRYDLALKLIIKREDTDRLYAMRRKLQRKRIQGRDAISLGTKISTVMQDTVKREVGYSRR